MRKLDSEVSQKLKIQSQLFKEGGRSAARPFTALALRTP